MTTRHTPTGFKVMPTSMTGHSLLVGIEEGRQFPSFSMLMPTDIAERFAHRDSCHTALVEALRDLNKTIQSFMDHCIDQNLVNEDSDGWEELKLVTSKANAALAAVGGE